MTSAKKDITVSIVWLALVLATVTSVFTSSHMTFSTVATRWALMGLCYGKCRLVFLHFMELNEAPREWRLFFELWIVGVMLMLGLFFATA